MLAENSECFEQLARLAAPGMVLHDIEHRVSEGRVDLLGKAGRDMVVIELKRDTGDHRLVGQCLQYLDHFERRLLWGLWDRVIGVTVAHQYTKFALKELSRLGLTAIRYGVNEKGNLLLGKA
jgi:RecB family endonuclease NucS